MFEVAVPSMILDDKSGRIGHYFRIRLETDPPPGGFPAELEQEAPMQNIYRTVIMRGGTARAAFFHGHHLPPEPELRDRVVLAILGSPDPARRQADGVGGGVSSTSKVAIISRSPNPEYDLTYLFGQVAVDQPVIDYQGNCGSILGAVGPFAVEEGLVPASGSMVTVRIHQGNTDKLVIAEVPVRDGRFDEAGDYQQPGVAGTGSRITLRLMDPGGAITGSLLPTGRPLDYFEGLPGIERLPVSIVDAGNPAVFVPAVDLGLDPTDLGRFGEAAVGERLERIRAEAAVRIGLVERIEEAALSSPAFPKIVVVSPPQRYPTLSGVKLAEAEMDCCLRVLSMGTLNPAIPVTAAICAAGAAAIPGTVVERCLAAGPKTAGSFKIGHPGGIIEIGCRMEQRNAQPYYAEASWHRTARRIMEGYALVPQSRVR